MKRKLYFFIGVVVFLLCVIPVATRTLGATVPLRLGGEGRVFEFANEGGRTVSFSALESEKKITLKLDNGMPSSWLQNLKSKLIGAEAGYRLKAARLPTGQPMVDGLAKGASEGVVYSSMDGRKQDYYVLGADSRTLKNLLVYKSGRGHEEETYTFENAVLRVGEDGRIEGYYLEQADLSQDPSSKGASPDLLARASKVLYRESVKNIIEKGRENPDFILPALVLYDQYLKPMGAPKVEILGESHNILRVSFEVAEYPAILDPSIVTGAQADTKIAGNPATGSGNWFSMAIGDLNGDSMNDVALRGMDSTKVYLFYNQGFASVSYVNADRVIVGTSSSNTSSIAIGDLNGDGRGDLVFGDSNASSNGKVYIFYQDGSWGTATCTTNCQVSNADVIISGEAFNSGYGGSLAVGDINNDGRNDIVVGSPVYNSSTGRLYVFHQDGSWGTVSCTTGCLATNADAIITGQNTTDEFSGSLAIGDLNSDGRNDLAVTAYRYPNGNGTGRLYVFHQDGSWGTVVCSTDCLAANADVIIEGEATWGYFGMRNFAIGDLNDDGANDLVVGASYYNTNAGRAYIFYQDGSWGTVACGTDCLASNADIKISGSSSNYFGYSLAIGDLGSDGKADLAISGNQNLYLFYQDGSWGTAACTTGCSATNADVVISGAGGNIVKIRDLNNDGRADLEAYTTGTLGVFLNDGSYPTQGTSADAVFHGASTPNFGLAMAVGDLNNDTKNDLAVGDFSNGTRGRVYLFFQDGIWGTVPCVSDCTAASADVIITGEQLIGGRFGVAMAIGDLNEDGVNDLAVGASGSISAIGRVYVYYQDGSWGTQSCTTDCQAGNADAKITGGIDNFGYSLAIGDLNNDAKNDLAVDAYYAATVGKLYLFYRDDGSWGSSCSGSPYTCLASAADIIITGESSSQFGWSFSIGDLNNDSKNDLAAGGYMYASNAGRAYIFYQDGSWGIQTCTTDCLAANADSIIQGEARDNVFGYELDVGDLNNDSKNDLAVSARQASSSAGRVYIYLQDSTLWGINSCDTSYTTGSTMFTNNSTAVTGSGTAWTAAVVGRQIKNNANGVWYTIFSYTDATHLTLSSVYAGTTTTSDPYTIAYCGASNADYAITGAASYDYFGSDFVLGDLDRDGKNDLVAGAFGHNSYTGRAYVFYQDSTLWGTSSCTSNCSASNADVTLSGGSTGDSFGEVLTVDDLNSDRRTDLVVSSAEYNLGLGQVAIFNNLSSVGPVSASATTLNAAPSFTAGPAEKEGFWFNQTSGTSQELLDVYFVNANVGYAVGYNGTILKTTNGGANWVSQNSGTTGNFQDIYCATENLCWAVGQFALYERTTDGGANWVALAPGDPGWIYDVYFIDSTCQSGLSGCTGWHVDSSRKIKKSTDGGTTWTDQTNPFTNYVTTIYCIDANTCWAADWNGSIARTTNGGANWGAQTSPTTTALLQVQFDKDSCSGGMAGCTGWISGYSGVFLKTTDGGANWISKPPIYVGSYYDFYFLDANNGWMPDNAGRVLRTTDGGENWTVESSGNQGLYALHMVDAQNGWSVGVGGTILRRGVSSISSPATPTNVGSAVAFSATATDPNVDKYYLAVCKTDSITPQSNAAPTCASDQMWAVSNATNSGTEAITGYFVTSAETLESYDWYAFVCDKTVTNPSCSPASQGTGDSGSPFAVNHRPSIGTVKIGPMCDSTASVDPGNARSAKITTDFTSGYNDIAESVAVQTDGKIVVAGAVWNSGYIFGLARYNVDGTLDSSFGTGGKVITAFVGDDYPFSVAIQPDGKIVVAGWTRTAGNYDFAIARYNSDGTLDTSFGGDGKVTTAFGGNNDDASSVAIQSDGKIVVAGYTNAGSDFDFAVTRYNTDGSLDTSFDTDGRVTTSFGGTTDQAESVAIQPADQKIVVAGVSNVNGTFDIAVVRYNTDGSLDTSFDTDGRAVTAIGSNSDRAYSVTVQSDGKVVAAGNSSNGSSNDFALVRYNTDGSLDTGFNTNGKVTTAFAGDDTAYSVIVQSDGKVVAAGSSNNNAFALTRYNTDGSLDTSFDTDGKVTTTFGGNAYAQAATLQSDGKIVAAGIAHNGSEYNFAFVRYSNSGALDDFLGYACAEVGVTDSDTSGTADTVDMYFCKTNVFTGGQCASGQELCHLSGAKSGDNAQCTGNSLVPIPTAHGSYNAYVFIKDGHGFEDAGTSNTQAYSVTDVAPTISSSGQYAVSDITLVAGDSLPYKVFSVTVSDNNGGGDLLNPSAYGYLYDGNSVSLSAGECVPNDRNCYPSLCYKAGSVSGTDQGFDCNWHEGNSQAIWFNANASSGWKMHMNPTDGTNSPTNLVDSNALTVNPLQGINIVESEIAFGALALGTVSAGQSVTIENVGNQVIDVLVQGTNMAGTPSGSIAASQQKWHNAIQDFTYASDGNTLVTNASGATTKAGGCADRDLAVRGAHASGSWSDEMMYWKLQIPSAQTAGSYSGTNTFVASANTQCEDGELGAPFKVTTVVGSGDDYARSVALQADGKIVAAGYSSNGSNNDFALVRYNTDGSLDTTFDGDGKVTTAVGSGNDQAYAVAIQSDGKIVAAGMAFIGSSDFALARYNTDGSLDTTFDTDGKVTTDFNDGSGFTDRAYSILIQADGKIVAAGSGGSGKIVLARYNANGSLDTGFGTGGRVFTLIGTVYSEAYSAALQADGKILVAGRSATGTNDDFALVRYNTNGSLDTSFDADGMVTTDFGSNYDHAYAIAIQSNGKIVVAGETYVGVYYDFALARYNADGSLDTSFDTDGKVIAAISSNQDTAQSVAIQSDGKIVVAGKGYSGSTWDFTLARFTASGVLDTSFDTDGKVMTAIGSATDDAYYVVIQPDSKIVVAGSAFVANNDFALVRYTSSGAVDN